MKEKESKILFVDDDPRLLAALRRMLRNRRNLWDMHFYNSGPEALDFMEKNLCDVIICDIRMPEMDGIQVLEHVKRDHPETFRVVLSGNSDTESILRSGTVAHRYLAKPCNADQLTATITQLLEAQSLLPDGDLRKVVSGLGSLPSTSRILEKTEAAFSGSGAPPPQEAICMDLSLALKVFQVGNSGFWGSPWQVADATSAVASLSNETLSGIVARHLERGNSTPDFLEDMVRQIGDHSRLVAKISRYLILEKTGESKLAQQAYAAGLFHDVGKLAFIGGFAEKFKDLPTEGDSFKGDCLDWEESVLGADHQTVGTFLLRLLGLPHEISQATAMHHEPDAKNTAAQPILAAVAMADYLVILNEPLVAEVSCQEGNNLPLELDSSQLSPEWRPLCRRALQEV